MKKTSMLYQIALGLLVGVLLIPPQTAQAQWAVFDTKQYILQVSKRAQEVSRWLEHRQKLIDQWTKMKEILGQAEDLVGKENDSLRTMAEIGRTVRASFELKKQLEKLITTRLNAIKRIDDRLRNGIFDPDQDLRDLDEYLRDSIGRSSQDTLANRERLEKMDNKLARLHYDLKLATARRAELQSAQDTDQDKLQKQTEAPMGQSTPGMETLLAQIKRREVDIANCDKEIACLQEEIKDRVMKYNIKLEEQEQFGQQVKTMNQAWKEFNDALDELNDSLNKFN